MGKLVLISVLLGVFAGGTSYAADPEAGKEKSRTCAACHGPDGNSATGDFPRLAGQHDDYLVKALKDYKSGKRKNAIMKGFASQLSKKDMEDLAAWFSSQKSSLHNQR